MYIDIVFDGPPSNENGRFIEVEDSNGRSVSVGKWLLREDAEWVLRLTPQEVQQVVDRELPDPPGWEGGFADNH